MKDYYFKVKWFNFQILPLLELWKIALFLSLITNFLSETENELKNHLNNMVWWDSVFSYYHSITQKDQNPQWTDPTVVVEEKNNIKHHQH